MSESAADVGVWFYEEDGGRKGPITHESIVSLIKVMKVTYGSLVWRTGYPEWLKAEDTELRPFLEAVSPPPITGKHVKNTVVWLLAFAPLIGMVVEAFVAYSINANDNMAEAALENNKYWFITLALNIGLSYLDENLLVKAGYSTKSFKGMTWLVPVYLYKRAKALGQSLGYFIVWLICFAISIAS
jgi:uncharacterized protein DUF4339